MSSCRARDLPAYSFARPSFLEGMARILDFGGVLNQYDWPSDVDALRSDWEMVGRDMRDAIAAYERER